MNTKDIHTTINKDLWKQGLLKEVKWSKALEIGIKALLNVNEDKEQLIKEIENFKGELLVREIALKNIQEEEKKKEEFDKSKIIMEFD